MESNNMKHRCIVLYAKPYSINDNGELNEGVSLWYIFGDNLSPVSDRVNISKGLAPSKCSLDVSAYVSFKSLPGVYDVTFALRSVANKPTLVPVGFEYVSDVVLAAGKDRS